MGTNYIQFLGPAIRNGLIQLESVPITPESLAQPESKAFLTLLAPALLHDARIVQTIAERSEDIIKFIVHREASNNAADMYEAYTDATNAIDFDGLYKKYESASLETTIRIREEQRRAANSRTLLNLQWEIQSGWHAYHVATIWRSAGVRHIPQGLSARDFPAHPATLRMIGFDDEQLIEKVKPQHFRIIQSAASGKMTTVDARNFLNLVIEHEAEKVFKREWAKATRDLARGFNNFSVAPGLTKAQFMGSKWAQSFIPPELRLSPNTPILPGLHIDEFVDAYVLPAAWSEAKRAIGNLPRNPDAIAQNRDHSDQVLRSIYVPAVALVFSLFFSLLTLGRLVTRCWLIWQCGKTIGRRNYRLIKAGIGLLTAAIIVGLPITLASGSLAQSDALGVAAKDGVPAPIIKAMTWTLDAEPLIFPLGNTLLSIPWASNPLHNYYDPLAKNISSTNNTEKVHRIQLTMPMSVKDLQRTLTASGYNAGPIDGVIGRATVSALKQFQHDNGTTPTGTQDYSTIRLLKALRQR